MNGIGAGDFRRAQDIGNIAIAEGRVGRTHADLFVGGTDVQAGGVGFRMDGDGLDAELFTGADDPKGDLSAIGYQNFLEHAVTPRCIDRADYCVALGSIRNSACPYSTDFVLSARIFTIRPSVSDSISFMSFIASTMHSTWPFLT